MLLTAAPSSTRHLSYEPTISRQPTTGAHYVQSNPRSWASIEDGKPRRQIRPMQKVLDSTYADGGGYRIAFALTSTKAACQSGQEGSSLSDTSSDCF
jgi:hypothetical protein